MTLSTRSSARRTLFATMLGAVLLTPPAAALTVFDPWNYAENVTSAARALEQINNQIASLQNEAEMLINQARNLASLPYSSLQQLQRSIERTRQLVAEAERIAYSVDDIDAAFQDRYGTAAASGDEGEMVAAARARWQDSVAAFEDSLKVQATVIGNLDTTEAEIDQLVDASQGATGALQAAQSGNQLLALQTQQLMDLIALVAADGRAGALDAARRASAEEQGREARRRFLTPGPGYTPGDAHMFYGD